MYVCEPHCVAYDAASRSSVPSRLHVTLSTLPLTVIVTLAVATIPGPIVFLERRTFSVGGRPGRIRVTTAVAGATVSQRIVSVCVIVPSSPPPWPPGRR